MNILRGKPFADQIISSVQQTIKQKNIVPTLISITIGDGSESNNSYLAQQKKTAQKAGISLIIVNKAITDDIPAYIQKLNCDSSVHGIILQRPIPIPWNDTLQDIISPEKDVEAINASSLGKILLNRPVLVPCTAQAAFSLITHIQNNLQGMTAAVVGQSIIVGKPLSLLLSHAGVTVTLCHIYTKNLKKITSNVDILCIAVGKPKLITKSMVKKNAIVIDIGINVVNGKIIGDVDQEVFEKCRACTPVPGGVGPVTTAILLQNTLKAYELQQC